VFGNEPHTYIPTPKSGVVAPKSLISGVPGSSGQVDLADVLAVTELAAFPSTSRPLAVDVSLVREITSSRGCTPMRVRLGW